MTVEKINQVLDEILGKRFQLNGEEPTEARQLIHDVLFDYYSTNKAQFFVTESLKHLVENETITMFDLFSLIGAVDALKE